MTSDKVTLRSIYCFYPPEFAILFIVSLHFCKFVCRIEKKVVSLTRFPGDDRMIIANKELLDEFVQQHANAARPLNRWVETVLSATWSSHADLKRTFPSADYVKNGRYVFNIGGNNYRIVAVVIFIGGVANIRFVGTHAEYDKIDSSTI